MTTTPTPAQTPPPSPAPATSPTWATNRTAERCFALGVVGAFVEERIRPLQQGYLSDRSEAVATLAQLRRGAGKPVGSVPELWGVTSDERFYSAGLQPGDDPNHAETAAHIALTLYAVHQQSRNDAPMHRLGHDLGGAVRRLMPGTEIDEPLRRRFVQAGSATTVDGLAYRLREIVTLLRRDAIPLDYGLLADQLRLAQQPAGMNQVRRAWGRGFHAYRTTAPQTPIRGHSPETPPHTTTPQSTSPQSMTTDTTTTAEDAE